MSSSVSVGILKIYDFITLTESVSANAGSERVIGWCCSKYSASKAADASGYCSLYLAFRVTWNIGLAVVCMTCVVVK